MATKQVEVTPEAAQKLGAPIKEAEKRTDHFKRACDLEYALVKTRDAITVIARGLEDFAQTDTVQNMAEADASLIFGTVNLLEYVADECNRAYWKGVRDE